MRLHDDNCTIGTPREDSPNDYMVTTVRSESRETTDSYPLATYQSDTLGNRLVSRPVERVCGVKLQAAFTPTHSTL